jgi:hypothetical protein
MAVTDPSPIADLYVRQNYPETRDRVWQAMTFLFNEDLVTGSNFLFVRKLILKIVSRYVYIILFSSS